MSGPGPEFEETVRSYLGQIYTETVVEHSLKPRNLGALDSPDGYSKYTGSCGDTIEVWLRVEDDIIIEIGFRSDGCSATVATGSMVTELAKRKAVAEASKISQRDVLDALGGLPQANEHCALLAAAALKEAIWDYREMKRDPWKKAYRSYGT